MNIHKRVLLKLSGESLAGSINFGFSESSIAKYCNQILDVSKLGVEVGIVVGGGNIFRGMKGTEQGFDRVKGDYMGMLATVMNGIAVQATIESLGGKARVLTSTFMEPYAERYSPNKARKYLQEGEIVIFSGGISNPFFTTDSAAALRAIEINADIVLKGTNVDGVYTADPKKDKNATKYNQLSFDEAIEKKLRVMDMTAFFLCNENNMPIRVFDIHKKGNLKRIVKGEEIGTLVH
ncbi:MAG: UMP kinase [Bacteroidota bacterium]|nr:UMP kinase [Bacteroidota bacterium]